MIEGSTAQQHASDLDAEEVPTTSIWCMGASLLTTCCTCATLHLEGHQLIELSLGGVLYQLLQRAAGAFHHEVNVRIVLGQREAR